MTLGLAAARRFSIAAALLLLLTIAPSTAVVTGESASPYSTLGHAWLSVNTNLRSASHISAWSIDDYLARNTPLRGLGHAFKSAETKYDVNALYLLAHAMHETAFGTSYIGQVYKNLFGWNAFDRDPSGLATRFKTYAAGIDYVASQISLYYLSPTGRFYGGAPTLRGMHHYASDPQWAMLIARIANGIVLPTLASRDITFDTPVVGDGSAGKPLVVSVATRGGALPDGLQAAYRFIPVAVVEAGTPSGSIPPADPDFRLARGESRNDQLRVTVTAPTRPGRYRLELELRDSDGTELTEYGVPEIPSAGLRVYGADAVSYAVATTETGLSISVTNEGTSTIPATGRLAGGATGAAPQTVPTVLSGWLVGPDGTPTLIARVPFTRAVKPGATWTADVAAPDRALLPGVLVLRVEVGAAPSRLGGSPPGVFRLGTDGVTPVPAPSGSPATSPSPSNPAAPIAPPYATPEPSPTPSPDPSSQPSTPGAAPAPTTAPAAYAAGAPVGATGMSATGTNHGSPDASDSPSADEPDPAPLPLSVGALTPIDAVTRVLLNPAWKPAPPAKTAGPKATATGTAKPGVVRLNYQPLLSPTAPGMATLRITNDGTTTLLATAAPNLAAPSASATPATGTADPATDGPTAIVQVTAIPAWGPGTEPIVLDVPLLLDIAPGRSVDVGLALPATTSGQTSYLVVARTIGPDGRAYAATLFWLRGAKPGPATQAAVAAPTLSTAASPAPARKPAPAAPAPAASPAATPIADRTESEVKVHVQLAPTQGPATQNIVPAELLPLISIPAPTRRGPR